MSRAHRRARAVLLIFAVVLLAVPFGLRLLGIHTPRVIGFRIVMVLVILANLGWWTFADESARSIFFQPRRRAAARGGVALIVAVLIAPMSQALLVGQFPDLVSIPTPVAAAFQLWHMGLAFLLPVASVLGYAGWAVVRLTRSVARRRRDIAPTGRDAIAIPNETCSLPRREFVKTAGIAAPMVVAGGAGILNGRQTGRFAVKRYQVPSPWLPQRLDGLTITQVSDLHIGRFYRPWMLSHLVDEVNRLGSDLVVVTGDVVDMSNDMLPPGIEAMRAFHAPRGLFVCIGNHDLIDDGQVYIGAVRGAGLDLLIDERRRLNIDGERLTIGAIDWARRDDGHAEHVARMLEGYRAEADGPLICLAHHPHAFDDLSAAGVPLTLSGHTHGGQLMFRSPRADGQAEVSRDSGIGALLFRYLRGFYQSRAGQTLFVNSGVGNWFPIRINAPAEIVQLRLVCS